MRGRLVIQISPADVGRRVSVRSRSGTGYTDAVGFLREWSDERLVVERKDTSVVAIPVRDVVAGRVLSDTPPAPRGR